MRDAALGQAGAYYSGMSSHQCPSALSRRKEIITMVAAASVVLAVFPGSSAIPAAEAGADPTMQQIYDTATSGHLDKAQQMIEQVLHNHPKSSKAHYVQAELYAKEEKYDLARSELIKAEDVDPGLSYVKPGALQALRAELGMHSIHAAQAETESPIISPKEEHGTTSRIPLAHREGTLVAPVIINDAIKLDFIVDSGAADVSIPADVFSTLIRAATISKSDLTGSQKFVNADGESHESRTFLIRSLKVGNIELSDIEASVAPPSAPLLLGQTFLKRFKHWSIDNTTQELVLER